jgi:transmembrane sensor
MNEIGVMSEAGNERPVLSPAEEIDAQAVAWFVKRINGRDARDWTDAAQSEFDAWLAKSAKHQVAYWRVEAGWDHVQLLAAVRPPRDLRDGAGIRGISKDRRRDWSLWFKRVGAVAAALAIAVTGSVAFLGGQSVTYSTPVGGRETVTLADGSHIELNTDTVVRIDSNMVGHGRSVELVRGEAFFQVNHDSAHPFAVTVGEDRLVDLGTEFLVRKDLDRMKIGLVEGSVRLESSDFWSHSPLATLAPGDLAVATANNVTITKGAARELSDDLAWRTGWLIFRRATLGAAVAEFNRYNTQKLVIADAQTADLRISSTFPVNGTEAFARVMQRLLGLHAEHRDGETVISH